MALKRSRELRPLSSEHHQALLLAFQVKKGLAGHSESAGAPKDLPGLLALVRRFEDSVFIAHTRAEEDLLGRYLRAADVKRMKFEHGEMLRLLDNSRSARAGDLRQALTGFANLLESHIRWEERELFPACEGALAEDVLAAIGHELEKRLVTRSEKAPRRA